MAKSKQILRTKFHRPPITDDLVERKLLIENLEKNRIKPFTLVSAPAGYGKSITVSQWIESLKLENVWISLDDEHNIFSVFIKYLSCAIRNTFSKSLVSFNSMVEAADIPELRVLLNTFINEIDILEKEFVLVLDDYHNVINSEIHDFINSYLEFPPQNLHLVIITRRDPPLKLNHLKTYNRSTELRMSNLSFSGVEGKELFKKQLGFEPENTILKRLIEITEGWAVGLKLTALSVDKQEDLEMLIDSSDHSNIMISEFLFQEVFFKQSKELQQILLFSSLLNRFSANLIKIIISNFTKASESKSDEIDYLKFITHSSLFIIPLDHKNKWYRYHHLFQQLLQKQLNNTYSKKEIIDCHRHISLWFASNSYFEEALRHALCTEDNQLATQIVIDSRYQLMNNEQWNRLINLLNLLPAKLIDKNPLLLVAKGFYCDYRGQMAEFFEIVNQIEEKYNQLQPDAPDYNKIKSEFFTLKAETCIILSDAETARLLSMEALELLPKEAQYIKTFAMYWYAFSNQMQNNADVAIKKIKEALHNPEDFNSNTHTRLYVALCAIYLMEGNLKMLKPTAKKSLALGKKYKFQETINVSYYYLVCLHYLQNDFQEAKRYFDIIYKNRYTSRIFYTTLCSITKSLIETSEGHFNQAWKTVNDISEFIYEIGDNLCKETVSIFKVELAMYQNNFSLDEDFDRNIDFNFPPLWLNYHRQLAEIRFLIGRNIDADLVEALKKNSKLIEFGYSINNVNFLIHALALQSLILWKQNAKKLAFESLNHCMLMASENQHIRAFLDLGSKMHELLKCYLKIYGNNAFLSKIFAAFNEESNIKNKDELFYPQKSVLTTENTLTQRELEILSSVANGLRNKEIAAKLFVSEDTIKKHLYRTFKKLEVSNRIQLIEKARELEILEKS